MAEELRTLYNTLMQIGTKGHDTIVMADCLRFLEKLIEKESNRREEDV